jgi:hypothetical protein
MGATARPSAEPTSLVAVGGVGLVDGAPVPAARGCQAPRRDAPAWLAGAGSSRRTAPPQRRVSALPSGPV